MISQEEIEILMPEIERRRIALTPRAEDDLDFYRELYSILTEMPWSVWERAGFHKVSDVRVYPDLTNISKDMLPIHLSVRIYYDHINRQDLSGFDRIDSRWADIAEYWKPYRDFLMRNLRLSLQRMEGLDVIADGEPGTEGTVTDSVMKAKLEAITLVNSDYEETRLHSYIEGLDLYPLIIRECRRQRVEQVRDMRRIMTDVGVAAIIWMVEQEDNSNPLVMELREYCISAKGRESDSPRDILTRYLLSSTKSINELKEMADAVVTKVKKEAIRKVPGLTYMFDRGGMAEIIRRDTLRLENMISEFHRFIHLPYIYRNSLLAMIEIAFKAIISNTQEIDARELVKDVIFPFGNVDDEMWNCLKEGAEIYKAHEKNTFSDYDVTIEKQQDGNLYVAMISLFGVREKGTTEQEARDKLADSFDKNHLQWITRLAVGVVEPGGRRADE